jgi:hypothetical protein
MRPTFDEQLTGAERLLRDAESDPDLAPGTAELIRNARRLISRVSSAWPAAATFLRHDNERMAALLGIDAPVSTDLATAAERNEYLRTLLVERIHELPPGPTRTEIGTYLRERVAADLT